MKYQAFLDGADWSMSDAAISRKLGVPYYAVRYYRINLGIAPGANGRLRRGAPARIHVPAMDWRLKDTVLAAKHDCSRERIRQLRVMAGKPSSRLIKAPHPPWWNKIDFSRTLRHNVTRLCKAVCTLHRASVTMGKSFAAYKHPTKYRWEKVNWRKSRNCDIARKIGASPMYVSIVRGKRAPETVGIFRQSRCATDGRRSSH